MGYQIKPENNGLDILEKNLGRKLGYIISGSEEGEMEAIYSVKVEGLQLISDPEHDFKAYVDDGNVTSTTTKEGGVYNMDEELTGPFVFEFDNVYLNPGHNPEIKQAALKVTILGEDDAELAQLEAVVYIAKDASIIEYFHINPSFMRNKGKAKLSWKCRNISEYSIHYENGEEVTKNYPPIKNGVSEGRNLIINISNTSKTETHIYLKAFKGGQVVKEINKRKIITTQSDKWNTTALTEEGKENESNILQLISNEYDHKIWALGRQIEGEKPISIRLWSSNTGGTGDWEPAGEGETAIKINEQDLHRPSVFFASSKNEPARLYFIGGSLLDITMENASSELCSYDIDISKKIGNRRQTHQPILGDPIMGHSCVVFPDADGGDNIWVIGGLDEFGNGLNEVKRWDGKQWHQETIPEGFPERCQFSATVLKNASVPQDKDKMEIWIGGGYNAFEGDPVRDIWKYSKTEEGWSWKQVFNDRDKLPLTICEDTEWLTAGALTSLQGKIFLTYVAKSERDRKNPSRWIDYIGKKEIKKDIIRECYSFGSQEYSGPGGWADTPIGRGSFFYLQTLGFNGCVWLIAQQDNKQGNINISDLYYLVTEQTDKNS